MNLNFDTSEKEAAKVLGICTDTLKKKRLKGDIPPHLYTLSQQTSTNQYLNVTEEIHDPSRCSFIDCIDDPIPSPNGVDRFCFKHQIDLDL